MDKVNVLPDYDPSSPLILGTTLHLFLQESEEAAEQYYFNQYPVIGSKHYEEFYKIKTLTSKFDLNLLLGMEFEFKLDTDEFIGYIDAIGKEIIIDFKYSKNVDRYKKSRQLSLYKYFYEKQTGKEIKHLYYLVVPKTQIRQKKNERPYDFYKRLDKTLNDMDPEFIKVEYEHQHVVDFLNDIEKIKQATEFPKNETKLCDWCDYQLFCQKGIDFMILPKNEREQVTAFNKKKLWIYGAPFSGKTTLVNEFPDLLLLSTDGNYKYLKGGVPAHIDIKDKVEVVGRRTERTYAWVVLKEVIEELEKKDNDFKTIAIDLIEDSFESCRLYMYDKLGIEHESDDSFKAWDIIRTEFLSTMRSFFNLDYENLIIISHENTKKDIFKKGEITSIMPNITEKPALKLTGMVDFTARVVTDGANYKFTIKPEDYIFGGGRLTHLNGTVIDLDYKEIMNLYGEAVEAAVEKVIKDVVKQTAVKEEKQPLEEEQVVPAEEAVEEKPKRRTRKSRKEVE